MGRSHDRNRFRIIPSTIKELLKQLVGKKVTIILDAEDQPECVEILAVCGDLLVAETTCNNIKFVDIHCICAVIVDREDLLEGIFTECEEVETIEDEPCGNDHHENDHHEDNKHVNDIRANERHENDRRENDRRENEKCMNGWRR